MGQGWGASVPRQPQQQAHRKIQLGIRLFYTQKKTVIPFGGEILDHQAMQAKTPDSPDSTELAKKNTTKKVIHL